jgi:hypothetical protein
VIRGTASARGVTIFSIRAACCSRFVFVPRPGAAILPTASRSADSPFQVLRCRFEVWVWHISLWSRLAGFPVLTSLIDTVDSDTPVALGEFSGKARKLTERPSEGLRALRGSPQGLRALGR